MTPSFISSDSRQLSFEEVSALVRLGRKYQFDDMEQQAVAFLKGHFAQPLSVWLKADKYVPAGWDHVHAIGAVNIARLVGCDAILPTAMMVCCALDGVELVRGFVRADGTRETLSDEDLGLCVRARPRLMHATTAAILEVFDPLYFDSDIEDRRHSCCNLILADIWQRRHCQDKPDLTNEYPFHSFEFYMGDQLDSGVCDSCGESLRSRIQHMQESTWWDLPDLLGVTVGERMRVQ